MHDYCEEVADGFPIFVTPEGRVATQPAIAGHEAGMRTRLKRIMDLVGALLLLVLLAAPTTLAAFVIRLNDRGPLLYRQRRVGKGGEVFHVLKLRTMREDAERTGPAWTERKDPRITPAGRWIRRTRLDEVPQLWNVLRGEMSLVGPRPEAEPLSRMYLREIPRYELRHLVKPGVTGWAQVSFRNTCSVEGAATKLDYDLYYIREMNFLFDMRILMKTVHVMLVGKGR